MMTTRIIALCACVTLAIALPARASTQVTRSTPQLPDEYKMKAEKEAEARKKAQAEKKAESEKKAEAPASADADTSADAAKKTDAAKTTEAEKKADAEKRDAEKKAAADAKAAEKAAAANSLEATRKAEAAKRAEAAKAAAARAERTEAAKKAEADRRAAAEQRKADARAAEAKKAEERKAAQAAKAEADKQKAADAKAADDAKKAAEAERLAARQQEILERARARQATEELNRKAAADAKAAKEAKDADRTVSAAKAAAEKAVVEKAAAADRAAAAERAAAQKAAADKASTDKAAALKPATPAAQPVAPQPAAAPTRPSTEKKESVDEKAPPAVIPAGQQPDSWKTQKERARDGGGPAASAPSSTGKPAIGASGTQAQKRTAAAKPKQPWRGWSDRAVISLNGGWQSSSFDLHDTESFAPAIQGDRESRTMAADYAVEPGVALDLSGVVRVWKGLGVGVAVTRFRDARDVPVSGTVPHPFFFNQARSVNGTTAGLRQEMAVHLDAVWVVPAGRKLQIGLFAGPSFYSVKQTVVRDFTFSEQYPYDSAALTGLTAEDESSSVTGFNAGADIGYYFTNMIGVGGVLRLGRGQVETSLGTLDVGGPEFGFGLRLRIPQSRNTARPATPQPPKTRPQPAPRPKD